MKESEESYEEWCEYCGKWFAPQNDSCPTCGHEVGYKISYEENWPDNYVR